MAMEKLSKWNNHLLHFRYFLFGERIIIDVMIMIFLGSICMLLSDNIIYSFWGIDIKWIVFLTIVIWGMIIKIIQSTLLMFDFE